MVLQQLIEQTTIDLLVSVFMIKQSLCYCKYYIYYYYSFFIKKKKKNRSLLLQLFAFSLHCSFILMTHY